MSNIKIIVFIAICSASICATQNIALADEKTEILGAWQKYFQSIRTLKVQHKSVTDKHPAPGAAGYERIIKFILAGSNYRLEVSTKQAKKVSLVVNTYNGKRYQKMTAYNNGLIDLFERPDLKTNLQYGNTLPILETFNFAFRKTDVLSIATLQDEQTWERLSKRITRVEGGTQDGQAGKIVSIRGRQLDETYKVFVISPNYFPISYTRSTHKVFSSGKRVLEKSYYKVSDTTSWAEGNNKFLFPNSTRGELYWDDKLTIVQHSSLIPGSFAINQPVRPEIFTLPKTQVDLFQSTDRK